MLELSFDYLFATYSYTSYWQVGDFWRIAIAGRVIRPKFAARIPLLVD